MTPSSRLALLISPAYPVEDLDDLDGTAILSTVNGRRTRGKQIDFVAAMERERLERSAGVGGSGGSAAAVPVEDEESDNGFDADYAGNESE